MITSWRVNFDDLNDPEWVFIRKNVPEIETSDSLIVQCAKYWYYWNLLAEQKAEWRFQIESLDDVQSEFSERSGLIIDENILEKLPKNWNSLKDTSEKVTWAELESELPSDLYENIREMAVRYGYID